jgi:hypothetical protein
MRRLRGVDILILGLVGLLLVSVLSTLTRFCHSHRTPRNTCANRLRTMGTIYVAEHCVSGGPPPANTRRGMLLHLYSHFPEIRKDPEVFLCPRDPDALHDRSREELVALWDAVEKGGPWPKGLASYAERRVPRSLQAEETFVLMSDRAAFHGAIRPFGCGCGSGLGDGVNVLYSDGKVEYLEVPAGWTVEAGGAPALEGLVFRPGR